MSLQLWLAPNKRLLRSGCQPFFGGILPDLVVGWPGVFHTHEAKVVVTLQKSSPPSRPFGPGTMTWTPSPDATDIAGNTCLTVDGVCKGTPVRESGHGRGPDIDF